MLRIILGGALLAAATPALAQDANALPDPNQPRDTVTIGAGAAYIPDYEGSDDYKIIPAAAVYSKPVITSLKYGNGRVGRRPFG